MEMCELTEIHSTTVQEMHDWLKRHQNIIAFYVGLLSTLIATTVVGVVKYHDEKMVLWVGAGPVLIIVISYLALRACERAYDNFLWAVTSRTKIEHDMGIDIARDVVETDTEEFPEWIRREPYVAEKFLDSRRRAFKNSKAWVKAQKKEVNFNKFTRILFWGTLCIGVVLLIGILMLFVLQVLNKNLGAIEIWGKNFTEMGVSEMESSSVIGFIESTHPVVNTVLGFLLLGVTIVYVILTGRISKANSNAVEVMKKQVEASLRPYVTISTFYVPGNRMICLRITNSGKVSAEDLELKLDKDFYRYGSTDAVNNLSSVYAFQKVIKTFAPGIELLFYLGTGHDLFKDETDHNLTPLQFTITAQYKFFEETFSEETYIDLEIYHYTNLQPVDRVEGSLESISESLKKISGQS